MKKLIQTTITSLIVALLCCVCFACEFSAEYTVTFDSDGGTLIEAQTVEDGGLVAKPEDPEKTIEGYTVSFDGWYSDDEKWDFEKNKVTGNITLTARYNKTAIEYTATIKCEDVNDVTVTYTVENKTEKLAEIKAMLGDKDGYRYTCTLPEELPLANAEYTIAKAIITYTATVKSEGAADVTVEYTVENRAEKLDEIKDMLGDKEGYRYTCTLPEELPLANADYTIVKTAIEYTATVKCEGANDVTVTYTVENRAEKLDEIKDMLGDKDGYRYTCALPEELPLADAEYTIAKAIITYTATVKSEGAADVTVEYTVENRAAKLAEIKAMLGDKDGYRYTCELPEVLPFENAEYTIVKTIIEYTATVIYKDLDTEDKVFAENEEIKFTVKNKDSKLVEIAGKVPENNAQYTYECEMPGALALKDVEIVITRVTNVYTVTFDVNGGSAVEEQSIKYGEKITAPVTTRGDNFKVEGWYDGSKKVDFDVMTVTGDVTLRARWLTFGAITPVAVDDVLGGAKMDNFDIKGKTGTAYTAHYDGYMVMQDPKGETEYEISFPKIDYRMYSTVKAIFVMGQKYADKGYVFSYNGTKLEDIINFNWYWFEIGYTDGAYYFSIYNTDQVSGVKVPLEADVVTGKKALTFDLTMPVAEYNNINLRNSVSDEKVIPVTQIRDYFDYQNAANKALNALPDTLTEEKTNEEYKTLIKYLTCVNKYTESEKAAISADETTKVNAYKAKYAALTENFIFTENSAGEVLLSKGSYLFKNDVGGWEAYLQVNNTVSSAWTVIVSEDADAGKNFRMCYGLIDFNVIKTARFAFHKVQGSMNSIIIGDYTYANPNDNGEVVVSKVTGEDGAEVLSVKIYEINSGCGTLLGETVITDADIINGNKPLVFEFVNNAWTQMMFGSLFTELA